MISILRTSCWIDFHRQAQLEVVIHDAEARPGPRTDCIRLTFNTREQLFEMAEKLRAVGLAMID